MTRRFIIHSLQAALILWLTSCARLADAPVLVFPELTSGVEQAQVLATPDGALLLAWTSPGNVGRDLWVSVLEGDAFGVPVRANDAPVNSIPIDEMRPALAASGEGAVALAWTDDAFDIRVARSRDGGRAFEPSTRMNQDEGNAMQEFPTVAFDDAGVLHAAWLDPRIAPEGAEEPADLYYGRLGSDGVEEVNLTPDQEDSVCGCCLPDIRVDGDAVTITFRNAVDGYRDPFQAIGTTDGVFSAPRPLTPPVWRIDACPVAGPIGIGDAAMWLDGSEGYHRLLWSKGPDQTPEVVMEDAGEVYILYPPREISGLPGAQAVLAPAVPASRLYRFDGDAWRLVLQDLPDWATSAAHHDGSLVVVGVEEGRLMHLVRPFPTE